MNWKKIIQELIDSGLTQNEIASKCATGQSYISDLLSGSKNSPRWSLGDSLVRLHKERCRCNPAKLKAN